MKINNARIESNFLFIFCFYRRDADGEDTKEVPEELTENAEVKLAIEIVEESAYTDEELAQYDKLQSQAHAEVEL